jgi:hypothetical protein
MKIQKRNFAALSLAAVMVMTAGCSNSNRLPTGLSRESLAPSTSTQAIAVAPVLGSAATFAVLGASTVTSTGASVVTGDLGVSPGIAVTGFPPAVLVGTFHKGDPIAAQAQLDLTRAYIDASGQSAGAILLAGNLGGLTLAPGVYRSTSSLEISSGDLTLDALGDPNAVFVFEIASTLITTTSRQVILAGGAKASNIYWQVGSSATLGVSSVFKGNILALASITVNTLASVDGRLLARSGAVTLDGNAVLLVASAPVDVTAPIVNTSAPVDGASNVALGSNVTASFNEPMSASSINAASFQVVRDGTVVSGTVSYAAGVATFKPAVDLSPLTTYTATLSTGAKDLAGNPLASDRVWSFTTVNITAGVAPVALNWANPWEILAGSTVTSTGATAVSGDLGVSPGTGVTGFPPGYIHGTIHAGDPTAAQAQLNLTATYDDVAGRTAGAVLLAGNLGGLTLTPGLYKSTSSLEISSGDLTLDAQGDANATFIFQMASTLTTTVGRRVILTGGAQAANIVWQVGSSATLGVSSVFKGTILAMSSITVTTGAAVEGRLLARTGAVTLDANVVVRPASSAAGRVALVPRRM